MIAQTAPETKTCATCPYFQSFGEANGRGWCAAFDAQAREHHAATQDCEHQIEVLEGNVQAESQKELDRYIEVQSEEVAVPQSAPAFAYRLSDSFFKEYRVYLGDRYVGKVCGLGGWRHNRQSYVCGCYASQEEAALALFKLVESERQIFDKCNQIMLSRFL